MLRFVRFFQVTCLIGSLLLSLVVRAQDAAPKAVSTSATPVTSLMRQMTGTWVVSAKMWPGPSAKPIVLPQAVARRELIRDAFLQEVMEPKDAADGPPFTRVAYFSFNTLNQQYEYVSVDSRLPQMMSYVVPGANKTRQGKVELSGASFVAPEWGTSKNVPFMYRLVIGPVMNKRQVVQLFLTEQNGQGIEFLAFEYVYSAEASPR